MQSPDPVTVRTAPIALFVYNRPQHTRRTVAALQRNGLAAASDLYIFSDAAKSADQEDAVAEVRRLVATIQGFRSVIVCERSQNLGLAQSIIGGVTALCREHGRVIVLEDDIVVAPHFLQFMNQALEIYADRERIMHISGYMFPIRRRGLPETFFYRPTSCWGWATWQRAWQFFEKDIASLDRRMAPQQRQRFNLDGAHDFWAQVEGNRSGAMTTWAIFWYASVFLRDGLCLHPARSLVQNIGHDGSGIHCGSERHFDTEMASEPVTHFAAELAENPLVLRRMRAYYRKHSRPGLLRRLLARGRRFWSGRP